MQPVVAHAKPVNHNEGTELVEEGLVLSFLCYSNYYDEIPTIAINLAQLHAVAHIRDFPRGLHANNCGEIPIGITMYLNNHIHMTRFICCTE